jgi:hypothetical protein
LRSKGNATPLCHADRLCLQYHPHILRALAIPVLLICTGHHLHLDASRHPHILGYRHVRYAIEPSRYTRSGAHTSQLGTLLTPRSAHAPGSLREPAATDLFPSQGWAKFATTFGLLLSGVSLAPHPTHLPAPRSSAASNVSESSLVLC